MDFDPRITSDGRGYGAEHGVHCNFHFGYVHDVFDEDAKKEESCVQALRHLIDKTDAEIHDLEDELAVLRCQLKWAESDEEGHSHSYEVCCAAFKRRIDSLTTSIQSIRDRNVLNGHDMYTSLEIQKPAERVHDIIDTLIRNNFSDPDEQVEDLSNEKNLVGYVASLDIEKVLEQKSAISESMMESREQMTVLGRLDKSVHTVSEESSSDAARCATKDSIEVRKMGSEVNVSEKTEVDARCTSEGKSGSLTSFETVTTQTALQQASNDEGNSKSNASQHGEREYYKVGSKIGGSGSSPLSGKTEAIQKADGDHDTSIQHVAAESVSRVQDQEGEDLMESLLEAYENQSQSVSDLLDHDTSIQHVAADSVSRVQDQEGEDPVEAFLEECANQSESFSDLITYGRKKSGLSAILKPQGHKVQRKNHPGDRKSIPTLMLKAQKKIVKGKSSSVENIGQSRSPSLKIKGILRSHPETNEQRKVASKDDIPCRIPMQALEAQSCQPKEGSRESASVLSPKVDVSKRRIGAKGTPASKSQDGIVVCLGSPNRAAVKVPVVASDTADALAVGSNSSVFGDLVTTELATTDRESLRQKLSEEPDFLNKLKVQELKAIMRHNKLRGFHKLKKDHIIEELTRWLAPV